MGEPPDWYLLIQASRYLKVAPWELLDQPSQWIDWSIAAQSAENGAKAQQEKRNAKSQALGRG